MFEEFLEETEYVEYANDDIKKLAELLKNEAKDEIELIQKTYLYVRDNIKHLWEWNEYKYIMMLYFGLLIENSIKSVIT